MIHQAILGQPSIWMGDRLQWSSLLPVESVSGNQDLDPGRLLEVQSAPPTKQGNACTAWAPSSVYTVASKQTV